MNKIIEHRMLLGIAAIAPLAVLMGTMKFGPGQSPDSIQYLSTAINMVNGRGAIDYSGNPLTTFPLGESTLIALGLLMGLKASVWILICNSISAFIFTICSYACAKA